MKISAPEPEAESDPILPMINVVFLLLIFFMLAGALHRIEAFDVEPPVSESELPEVDQDSVVLVSADGRLAFGDDELDELDLQLKVLDLLAAQPEAKIRLKADGQVDARRVIEVMELLSSVGVDEVLMLTLEPER
ncbi:biopolymer transporter ExbD [Pelagibius sp. Alg239-R121]|uniref:ExbD/TolR family protein n=1 Tax=Pelagibius sp. Alg239-R121 TaxID=2993448 RepID=UPI0024A6DEC0|nr:biopolymer transporter ExbD [Pelagibius sp. Alg239-R121]